MTEVCSGQILNNKYHVPCDPESRLFELYGPTWNEPKAKKYKLNSISFKNTMTEDEWSRSITYYLNNGTVDVKRTLSIINQHLNNTIKVLPDI